MFSECGAKMLVLSSECGAKIVEIIECGAKIV